MAYFSNGSEGMCFDEQCGRCKFGQSPCPIALVQMEYNYDQIRAQNNGDHTARKILNHLVTDDGVCAVFEMAKADFEIEKREGYNGRFARYQGAVIPLEIIVRENRFYLCFWNPNGRNILCQIKKGELHRWKYTEEEIDNSEEPLDPFAADVLTFSEWLEEVLIANRPAGIDPNQLNIF